MNRILRIIAVAFLIVASSVHSEEPKSSENDGPGGVRVRWYDAMDDSPPVPNDRQMIEWGTTGKEVEALLGEDHYADWQGEDLWLLGTRKYGGWWADFGDEDPRDYRKYSLCPT